MNILEKISDWSKTYDQADFLIESLGPYAESIKSKELPLILFGAGSAGRRLLPLFSMHGAPPVFVCDNDPRKAGAEIFGVPIVSVETAYSRIPQAVVVLAINQNHNAIREQCIKAGFHSDHVRTIRQTPLEFYTHIFQWYWKRDDLEEHAAELARAYTLLADKASQRLYLQRIALLSHGADYKSYVEHIAEHSYIGRVPCPPDIMLPENYYYFNNNVVRLTGRETLVDCGAFDGDSLEQFLLVGQQFSNSTYIAHCLEPDPQNFSNLAQTYDKSDHVHLYPTGAWSERASLNFVGSDSPSVDKPSSARVSSDQTGTHIEANALDALLGDEHVSFIKMDIEGAEKEALQGAARIISHGKPTLAISAYHHRDDIFRIPLLIEQLCPGYRFHLRLFSRNFSEMVLFAIPVPHQTPKESSMGNLPNQGPTE